MTFDFRPERAPVEIEVVDGDGALGVAHPEQGDVARAGGEIQLEGGGGATPLPLLPPIFLFIPLN